MFDYTIPANASINFKDEALLDKRISSCVAHFNSRKGREDAHLVLEACCDHAVMVNGCDKLTKFINLLPDTAPKRMMFDWLSAFTSFKLLPDKAGTKKFLGRGPEGEKLYAFDPKGRDKPFYLFKKDPKVKAYSAKAAFENVFKIALAKQKAGKLSREDEELLTHMAEALKAFKPTAAIVVKKKKAKAKAKAKVDVEIIDTPAIALAA